MGHLDPDRQPAEFSSAERAPAEIQAESSTRLGAYLRRLREGYGYTLRKVEERALAMGEAIDNSQLSRFEKGKAVPSFDKLRALGRVFNVPVQNFSDVLDLEEYRHLKPGSTDGRHLLYFTRYCAAESEAYRLPDDVVEKQARELLLEMYPSFDPGRIEGIFVSRAPAVLPTRTVGARRLPVGPSIACTASLDTTLPILNSVIFFPFATISLFADLSRVRASLSCSFRLAGDRSSTLTSLASKNLAARLQLVQPFR